MGETMDIDAESEQLRNAWLRHSAEFLDTYLVRGVENPCLNPQSVVMRSLIIESLAPHQHDALIGQEKLYSACACQTLLAIAEREFNAFTAALDGERNADLAYPLPAFLKDLRENTTQAPFSVRAVWRQIFQAMRGSFSNFVSPFESLWRERLERLDVKPLKLLEAGCGSANDYRYFERYGLDRAVDYTGVDICATNILNAQRRCPKGKFLEANAIRLPFPDKSFDFYCAFDLFEHLSIEAMECTIREAVRVTRRGLWLSFFQLDWRAEHEVILEPPYHRNILSIPRTVELLKTLGCDARVIDIQAEWARDFPAYRQYNPMGRVIDAQIRV
jgi:SAM-dependent methyltransferase